MGQIRGKLWDLQRYYPEYVARISIKDIAFVPSQIDEGIVTDDNDEIFK